MLFRVLNKSILGLFFLTVSFLMMPASVFADDATYGVDVYPFYFTNIDKSDTNSQLETWGKLMKYKLFATGDESGRGITFAGQNIKITDEVGYVGSATGNLTMSNTQHVIGGPLMFGGSFENGDGSDTIITGPTRFLKGFNPTFNSKTKNYFVGNFCFDGGYNENTQYGVDLAKGKILSSSECATFDKVYAVETTLDVPKIDTSVTYLPAINSSNTIKFIHVPPETALDHGGYNTFIESISFSNNGKLYVIMPPGGRLTKVFLNGSITGLGGTDNNDVQVVYAKKSDNWNAATSSWKNADKLVADAYNTLRTRDNLAKEGKSADSLNLVIDSLFGVNGFDLVSNGDYLGNLLFYTPEALSMGAGQKNLQGTFISANNIKLAQHTSFAGQLLAKTISIDADFEAKDFIFVPFNPSWIESDPKTNSWGVLEEGLKAKDGSDSAQVLNAKLSKSTTNDVAFKYCFVYEGKAATQKGDAGDAYASSADIKNPLECKMVAGKDSSSVFKTAVFKAGSVTLENPITLTVVDDDYVENVELFRIFIFALAGAILEDKTKSGYFNISIKDNDFAPKSDDLEVVADEDEKIVLDKFPAFDVYDVALDHYGIIVMSLPSEGSLTLNDKKVAKGDTIYSENLSKLVFSGVKNSYGTPYTSFKFRVLQVENSVAYPAPDINEVTISLNPVNDSPIVKPATYSISGHIINGGESAVLEGTIPVSDVDDDSFTYAFDSTDPNFDIVDSLFEINPNTGVIHVKSGIELNENIAKTQYDIKVVVSDKSASTGNADDILSAKSQVSIKVSYANNAPVIVTDTVSVPENSKSGTLVDSLKAIDKDSGDSVKVFKLVSKSEWFVVSEDGIISVKENAKIDYEVAKSETLKIQVCDEYDACSEKSVVVAIQDVKRSQVEIVKGENTQNTWPNPTTIYTNIPSMELTCSYDGSADTDICMDTTLVEGCHNLIVSFDNPELDGAAYDTVEVCYSSAAPLVTVSAKDNNVVADNIYTVVESAKADDSNIYVNSTKNPIEITVKDTVLGESKTFKVELELGVLDVPKTSYSTMKDVVKSKFVLNEDVAGVRTPVNGERIDIAYKQSFNGKDSVTITYSTDKNGDVIKTSVINGKGKTDSIEVITVSYMVKVDGKDVCLSFMADAMTGEILYQDSNGNLYQSSSLDGVDLGSFVVSFDQTDAVGNHANVSYVVNESGEIVKSESGDTGYKISYSYTNKYGNSATQSVFIVLDQISPKVEILSPAYGTVVYANFVDVVWTVNGVEQDTLLVQGLEKGANEIVRFYKDKAGNIAADTIFVIMKDAKNVVLSIEQPVTEITKEKVEEFYATNPPEEGETFAVSIRNPSSGEEVETLIGGSFDSKKGSGESPYGNSAGGLHLGPTLAMDVKLPVISAVGGLATLDDLVNRDGNVSLEGVDAAIGKKVPVQEYIKDYCVDGFNPKDFSKANLYDSKMEVKIWVYTSLGNFVDYFAFTQNLNDPSYTNEAGLLQMYFEMKPDKDGFVRTENGRLYSTGAYLYKVDVKIRSELKCTLPPVNDDAGKKKGDVVKSSDDMLKPFGYKRPKI